MVLGIGGGLQWVVPGRDIMGGEQEAGSEPAVRGDRAGIHTCRGHRTSPDSSHCLRVVANSPELHFPTYGEKMTEENDCVNRRFKQGRRQLYSC